jgi:uncharacterized membrane protein
MDHPLSHADRARLPAIRHVDLSRPFVWLERGWDDLTHNPGPSLAHGLILAAIGWLVLLVCSTHVDLLAAAISGFLLVGPVFGAAFYELSRLRSNGQAPTFDASVTGAARNARALVQLGLILAVLGAGWALVSRALFLVGFGGTLPALWGDGWQSVFEWASLEFALTYLATGAVIALIAFLVAAISAPLIFANGVDTSTGIFTSLKAAAANPLAMALWAAIIAVLVAVAFATFLLGAIVILPLLGHATWHAARDLVVES